MPGAMLFSNINGVALSDQRFGRSEAANDASAYVSPEHPVNVDMMQSSG
jgi:hypothetical protein